MATEISRRAGFSEIRYAQCWEDADILLRALEIRPGDVCVSIASAGDNTLAMLAAGANRVIALDLNPAQLACLELRVAAYRALSHSNLLALIGSRPHANRGDLYRCCRPLLCSQTRRFWDAHSREIAAGIGGAGKFERYFARFRAFVLPLIHPPARIARLLESHSTEGRATFYDAEWDTWRWRLLFRAFFSRTVMGRLGRDPSFFRYVHGDVPGRILARARYAMTTLDPAQNPYIQWILMGRHTTALPYALRPENFERIRARLDRLEWHCCSLEDFLQAAGDRAFDRFNLSDIFEYMSEDNYLRSLERVLRAGRPGARLAYWNMLVERRRPAEMAGRLRALDDLARSLHGEDKAFFYQAFVLEEIA